MPSPPPAFPAKHRPRWLAILDRCSVAISGLAWCLTLLHVTPAYTNRLAGVTLILGALLGYLLADFFSGSVHWLADRYFDPKTPLLGPALIAPFREHHVDPLAMTRHDFFEVSGNNGLLTIPLAALIYFLPLPFGFFAQTCIATLLSLGLAVIATNQFHCWAHAENPPRAIQRLQHWGVILPPEHHAKHHGTAHDRNYCVTSGLLNPLLDGIHFFNRLEALIESVTGRPRRTV
jgi:hypothetical protein